MSKEVYANGMAIAGKGGSGRVVAAFPSVCQSPPGPPAGPLPVPYPLSSFSRDLKKGSKRVKIGGKPAALQGQSYYQTKPLGNEAATRSFGASIVSHQVAGKTCFSTGSIDVKFEGNKVCRHLDPTTSNHGSEPGEGPSMGLEKAAQAPKIKPTKLERCPCCNAELHANQFDPVTKEPYEPISEMDWYQSGDDKAMAIFRKKNAPASRKSISAKYPAAEATRIFEDIKRKRADAARAIHQLKEARQSGMECHNLNPPDDKCGVHLKKTNALPRTSSKKERAALGFTEKVAKNTCSRWKAMGFRWVKGSEIVHKTPLSAGGCPNGENNLVPKGALSQPCLDLDVAQTKLQGYISFVKS